MNIGLIIRTVRHLKMTQVAHQFLYRLHKPRYVAMEAPCDGERPAGFKTEPIARWTCLEGKVFSFLNLEHEFAGWNFTENGMLWAYNQNYMDWLNQDGISKEDCCYWIDKFIEDVLHTENNGHTDSTENTEITNYKNNSYQVGLDPYPIALRSINWVKVLMRWPDCATKERKNSLYSQLSLLERKLEYHLLGNHLLEDAYALYIGATYFGDKRLLNRAKKLLIGQLEEQVLPDGAHYEQSPMYHCILLDRLLDCINIFCHTDNTDITDILSAYAEKMLGHLESVVWEDGSIPMVNDAAYGIAPTPDQIFDYARRLGLKWEAIPMKECGYRKMKNDNMEAIVDVGNITATYQPGHTHADTFNYELRIDGEPFVVDTGISTYNKTERRQLERSSITHNCVVVDGKSSSEVWGGFRVGKRCHTDSTEITDNVIMASHDGFPKPCRRRFEMKEDAFVVEDWYDGEAVSYIHLAEGADEKRIAVEGATSIEIKEERYSTEYNRFRPCKVMAIHFNGKLRYSFSQTTNFTNYTNNESSIGC